MDQRKTIWAWVAGATLAALVVVVWGGVAEARAQGQGTPAIVDAVNVVFVLDASGSMAERMPGSRESKMQVARRALRTVVEGLPQDTRVGVLSFSGVGKDDDWLHPLGPLDAGALRDALDRLQPDGATPLGETMRIAADRLLERRAEQGGYGGYRMVVVTDGEASDPELVERWTPRAMARGLTIQVIGVAMGRGHMLSNRVHAYRAADDAASLEAALSAAVAEIRPVGGVAGGEDFAVLEPLPAAAAGPMLETLRRSGNRPLDERAASASGASAGGGGGGAAAVPAVPGGAGSTQRVGFSLFGGGCCCTLLPVVVVLAVVSFLVRVFRGRGER